ncbi:MAG: ECF transporter S component [Anaerofustis stercorihominis]|nr:ECF transporter S component [Anaerofustis stercorihominis]
MNKKTLNIVISAMFAAIVCIATIVIVIPSPLKGYINLGDSVVLLSGWILSPAYGFLAAGIGSALADLYAGYITYIPATFIIKGTMAAVAHKVFGSMSKKYSRLGSRIISGIFAEIIMVLGYYVFEGFLYGFIASAVNIPVNMVQGGAGLIIGTLIINIITKSHILSNFNN